ncbi:MAG: glycosyltransferase, partial [Bacteroidales bacterium]|nr:glycosyltransferase [Bacteroidales bacterium]
MKYKVSVVTPFHNVDMQMFCKCAESVKRQSIGFGNIEWVIVIHNCDPGYFESVSSMFADYPNVIVRELNNGARTPSSPRNFGTSLASGLYVGYLDADDSYTPDCLEVAVREAVDTQSQIVWFRREVEMERPGLAPPTVSSLWDNTQKRIVVERGNWDDAKMFSGFFGFATSYIYGLEFLRSNNLTFSDTMHFGEDFLFVVESCAKAERICYLPQHIGYHYFVNSGSLVQNANKSSEELINYAEGFRDLFRIMRSYGVDTQEISQVMCGRNIARFTLGSPQLTVEDRRRIKEILGTDVCAMHQLLPNKFFDAAKREMLLRMSRDVILNPENPGGTVLRMML